MRMMLKIIHFNARLADDYMECRSALSREDDPAFSSVFSVIEGRQLISPVQSECFPLGYQFGYRVI